MLEDNLFGDLVPGNTTPNRNAPTYIPAPPKIPTPSAPDTPLEAENKQLDIDIKKQRLQKGIVDAGDAEIKSAEQKAAFLTTNLLGNVNILNNAVKADPSSTAPTWDQLAVGILGDDVKNAYLPEQRQVIENSQRLITDAALTLGTGAAYTPEQIEAYRRGFFPQVGDKPAAVAAKREALRVALLAAKINAGGGADKVDQAMAAMGFSNDPLAAGGGMLPSTAGSMGSEGQISGNLDLTGLGDQPGKMPNAVPGSEEDDWPIGATQGDWKRVDDHTIQNLKTGQRSTYTGLTVVGGGDAARAREEEARARAEAYRAKQERFNPLDPRETMLVHGMSGTLSDEAAGVGSALSHLFTGQNPIEGYTTGRDAERLRIEDSRRQLGGWGTAMEIGGGALSFNPEAAAAPVANVLARLTQGAKGGAAGGTIYGFGSGEGFGDSVEKAAVGGGLGAAAGVALPALGLGAERLVQGRGLAPDLAAAARQEGVRLRRPMFDEGSHIRTGKLEGTAGGAPVIQRAMRETADDIEAAAARTGGTGNVQELETAGGQVQNAGRRFIQRTKGVADRLYNRARSLAGPDAKVTPREGLAQLRRELQDLRQAENVNQGEIDFINDIGSDLTNGPLTVDAIRAIRQGVRGRIDEKGLTSTQADARAHRILDALHTDINDSLPSAAATAFRRADTYYRERMTHIDDILERFIGNTKNGQTRLSGEAAFRQLKTMASPGGDGRRLAAMWRDMTPDEQADVAATLMRTIGRASKDPTDATAPFSVDLFITHASTLSPSARRTIFGPSGAESVTRLINLSRSLQAAGREINRTKSGSTVMRTLGGGIAAALMGGGTGAVAGGAGTGALVAGGTIAGMAAKLGINNLSARALMSPRVSNWLADVANATTAAQVQRLSSRLGVIASREPALAGELNPLQEILSGQVRPAPLAASDTEDQQ